jgi:hypothetical protein
VKDTCPVEPKPESKPESKPIVKEMKPIDLRPEPKPEPKPLERPVERAEIRPIESMEKQNISFNDQLETFEIPVDEDSLQIGEDIPLNVLSFEDLEKASPCEIDLGIVEL